MREISQELQGAIKTTAPFFCVKFGLKMRICKLDSCTYFDDCHKNELNIKGDEIK